MDPRPIGIFDSGLGGLTAAKTLEEILPCEDLIYFGDSRNAPYGTRTRDELAKLACANAGFLRSFDCKAILVACGTVSSNVMDVLSEHNPGLPIFGVVDAACIRAAAVTKTGRVAVAATETTIRSGAFTKALKDRNGEVQVIAKSCQSLVALAERGHFSSDDPEAVAAVAREFAPIRAQDPDTLLLACTHFPLFRDTIADYMGSDITLLSVGEESAHALKRTLTERNMLADRPMGRHSWYTSGNTDEFEKNAAIFLGYSVHAAQYICGGTTDI